MKSTSSRQGGESVVGRRFRRHCVLHAPIYLIMSTWSLYIVVVRRIHSSDQSFPGGYWLWGHTDYLSTEHACFVYSRRVREGWNWGVIHSEILERCLREDDIRSGSWSLSSGLSSRFKKQKRGKWTVFWAGNSSVQAPSVHLRATMCPEGQAGENRGQWGEKCK